MPNSPWTSTATPSSATASGTPLSSQAALDAVAQAANNAQETADGKIQSYFQTTAPTGLTASDAGDIWFDTAHGNKVYRWSGTAWVEAQDSGIAKAISDAATAQGTADGKAKVWYQASAPTGLGAADQGDLWVDTDNNLKVYAWDGTAWVLAQDWITARGIANEAKTATDAIADDAILSKGEKSQVIIEWNTATQEKASFDTAVAATGVDASAYNTAFGNLQSYLQSLTPAWDDTTKDTALPSGTDWRNHWQAYYSAKSDLIIRLGAAAVPIIQAITKTNVSLTTNASLSVDGYACVGGETIMLAAQSTPSQNGLYTVVYTPGGQSSTTVKPSAYATTGSGTLTNGGAVWDSDPATYASVVPASSSSFSVVWSGWGAAGSTSGTLSVSLDVTILDPAGIGGQTADVWYSTDAGANWTLLGSYDTTGSYAPTAVLTGVTMTNVQVKVTTSNTRTKLWDEETGKYIYVNSSSSAKVYNAQVSTGSTSSANFSLNSAGPVADKSAWNVLSGTTYGGKKWLAAVDGSNNITLTLSPDQGVTVPIATASVPGIVKPGTGLSVSADGSLNVASAGSVAWGNITGSMSAQTDLQSALNTKEPSITAGTASQFWKGNKTWAALASGDVTGALGFTPLSTTGTAADSDKLDGQHGAYYADIPSRLGYTPVNKAGDTMTGYLTVGGVLTVPSSLWHKSSDGANRLFFYANNTTYIGSPTDWRFQNASAVDVVTISSAGSVSMGALTASGVIKTTVSGGLALGEVSSVGRLRYGIDGATSFGFVDHSGNYGSVSMGALTATSGTFSGNVGIGTTSPTNILYANRNQAASTRIVAGNQNNTTGATAGLGLEAWGGSWYLDVPYDSGFANPLIFSSNSTERMRITASGNVGIGTTSPTNILYANRNQAASTRIVAGNLNNATGATAGLGLEAWGGSWYLDVPYDSGFANPLIFSSNSTERMRITASGNVGIGTASPVMKLDIYSNNERFRIGDGTNNLVFGQWDTSNNRIESAGRPLYITTYTGTISLGPSGNTALTITTGSNVGIGTTSPGSKLTVAGPIESSENGNSSGSSGGIILRDENGNRYRLYVYGGQLKTVQI